VNKVPPEITMPAINSAEGIAILILFFLGMGGIVLWGYIIAKYYNPPFGW